MPPEYQREIELLTGFARDLRRLRALNSDAEREELEGLLHRRLPAVERAMKRAGVVYISTATNRFRVFKNYNFLAHALDVTARSEVLRLVERAIGIFEHGLAPEPATEGGATPAPRPEPASLPNAPPSALDRLLSAPMRAAPRDEALDALIVRNNTVREAFGYEKMPLSSELYPQRGRPSPKAPEAEHRAEVPNVVTDLVTSSARQEPARHERRSLREHVEGHPFTYLVTVAIAAFAMGVTVGIWAREGWDAAVQRTHTHAAPTASPPAAAAPSRPPGSP